MDEAAEVETYADAAAEKHLARLDGRFVRRLLRDQSPMRVLDVGCGPGQILSQYRQKRARRGTGLLTVGIDLSLPMLLAARHNGLSSVALASARQLPFSDGSFDLVLSNSLLHHLAAPGRALCEMARCVAPGGALLSRDLRRPPRALAKIHLAFLGRHYRGEMKRLFEASVRAAYTRAEVVRLHREARLSRARVLRRGLSYLEGKWARR